MRSINNRIISVIDGKPIDEKNLEKAIKVAIIIQGIRHKYGSPFQYDKYRLMIDGKLGRDKQENIASFVSGRVFPTLCECNHMIEVYDQWRKNGNYPVPRTDEVMAYLDYFCGKTPWYMNPMYEHLNRTLGKRSK